MNIDCSFPQIESSYWLTQDKAWLAQRAAQWPAIELMLINGGHKSKKALTIIKRYFLKGIMPDFAKLQAWENHYRHLDLFCFLWLHPSWDETVLTQLRNEYVHSPLVRKDDVQYGLGMLKANCCIMACQSYSKKELPLLLQTDGHNELLFSLIMGDLSIEHMPEAGGSSWSFSKNYLVGIASIITTTNWLCHKKVNFINEDCLYQFDNYLDYWYLSCPNEPDYFQQPKFKRDAAVCEIGLYRIHHFDTEKEGDTCRSRYIHKIRKILDERAFIPQFKQMWLGVKAGTIVVDDPWE